ncbi:hypothetical protein D623_10010894 [Myotis brandtii]|uniref:Uncharacterized protein n=1 Tax=Myotis brandtii TaxID=109478 RepID=S7PFE5_MYOBR|nr:hypothetical protein D623_10010894 [Myotis brandtii]
MLQFKNQTKPNKQDSFTSTLGTAPSESSPQATRQGYYLNPFLIPNITVRAWSSFSKEPVEFVRQCGNPEKPVLPLRERVSWCLGLWEHRVLISKLCPLLGCVDISVEGKGILPRTGKLALQPRTLLRIHNHQEAQRSCK